jgi:hypothetical protein
VNELTDCEIFFAELATVIGRGLHIKFDVSLTLRGEGLGIL